PQAVSSTPTPAPANTEIPIQEAALAAVHDDYYQVIAEVRRDLEVDPALRNTIWGTANPYKEAYNYGIKKRKLAENLRQGNLSQAYAESGAAPVQQDANTLTPIEKDIVKKMQSGGADITEEKYLAAKIKIAKRGGR
ncbi:MAG: hypothetical protein ACYTEO_19185, partial [Planctomycetota bacterium]